MKRHPNPRDWRGQLKLVLNEHNHLHATRSKAVSYKTREEREQALFRIFMLLRQLGCPVLPANLGGRHVQLLVDYWTAAPALAERLAAPGSKVAPRDAPVSPAYLQQQLSFLRVFAGWIGKPGMVLPAERYCDPALARREQMASRDRSWEGNGVDPQQVLAKVAERDPVVALQLEVMMAFGLRRKEAVMFSPLAAEVPAHALPASAPPSKYLAFLRVKRGTKGGRLRYTAIRNPAQEAALERARRYVEMIGQSHIGKPGLTLAQSLDHFSYVLAAAGVTRSALGVTAHGLRHQFAADLYLELAELPPPVRGGVADPTMMNASYLEVARQLGHGRPQIAGAYLGARTNGGRVNTTANADAQVATDAASALASIKADPSVSE